MGCVTKFRNVRFLHFCAEKSGKQHRGSHPPLQANAQPTTVSILTADTVASAPDHLESESFVLTDVLLKV